MWPFNRGESRQEQIDNCDHEWEEPQTDAMTYPERMLYDNGDPYVKRIRVRSKGCMHCPKVKEIDRSEEKVYLSVDRIEPQEQ